MYTLQAQYLVRHPVHLPPAYLVAMNAVAAVGYWIFRSSNNQKDRVRKTNGETAIWGRPAQVLRAKYTTSDGSQHTSLLLVSGFWGVARHFNYVGDLLMCLSFCASC